MIMMIMIIMMMLHVQANKINQTCINITFASRRIYRDATQSSKVSPLVSFFNIILLPICIHFFTLMPSVTIGFHSQFCFNCFHLAVYHIS